MQAFWDDGIVTGGQLEDNSRPLSHSVSSALVSALQRLAGLRRSGPGIWLLYNQGRNSPAYRQYNDNRKNYLHLYR